MSRASLLIVAIVAVCTPQALSGQELPAAQISAGYSHLASPSAIIDYGSDESGDASHSGWFAEVAANMFATLALSAKYRPPIRRARSAVNASVPRIAPTRFLGAAEPLQVVAGALCRSVRFSPE